MQRTYNNTVDQLIRPNIHVDLTPLFKTAERLEALAARLEVIWWDGFWKGLISGALALIVLFLLFDRRR